MTAQNGMHSGAAVNVVTKSGTNSFRGDAFEFFRHHSFNATDPFATKNPDGTRKRRRVEAQSVRRDARRTDQDRQAVLLLRLPGDEHRRSTRPTTARSCRPRRCWPATSRRSRRRRATPARAKNLGAPFVGNRVDPAQFSKAALNITTQAPEDGRSVRPCAVRPAERDRRMAAGRQGRLSDGRASTRCSDATSRPGTFTPPPFSLEAAEQNLLVTRIGGRDNLAQTLHDRRELRHQPDDAERGSLCVQPHRHPSHEHRLLLRARSRHQHLQLHAELHAADRRAGGAIRRASSSEAERKANPTSRPTPGRSATT